MFLRRPNLLDGEALGEFDESISRSIEELDPNSTRGASGSMQYLETPQRY
jgi:hypothetical protein